MDTASIFFGTKSVVLATTSGTSLSLSRLSDFRIGLEDDEAHLDTLRRRLEIQQPSGVFIPAIPSLDILPINDNDSLDNNDDDFPWELKTPVVKVPNGSKSGLALRALASGCRSALVYLPSRRRWFRIKGCGNDDQGFILRHDVKLHCINIRGSAFFHTATRELYMSALLSERLRPLGIHLTNTPVGMYRYSGESNLPAGKEFPLCGIVMQTSSDRRFGCHLLSGLMVLLPLIADTDKLRSSINELFPPGRFAKGPHLIETSEMTSIYAYSRVPPGFGQNFYSIEESFNLDSTTLSRAVNHSLPLDHSRLQALIDHPPEFQWRSDPSGVNALQVPFQSQWIPLWHVHVQALLSLLLTSAPGMGEKVLAYMFSRFGYEIGRFLRELHALRISWGTYQDRFCFEGQWHCNAHSNNISILPFSAKPAANNHENDDDDDNHDDSLDHSDNQSFLAFLDFDMAFEEKDFFQTSPFSAQKGNRCKDISAEFDHLLRWEMLNLLEVVTGGGDGTVGAPVELKHAVLPSSSSSSPSPALLLFTCLTDQLVLSFLDGYHGKTADVAPHDPILHQMSQHIIALSLILTEGLQA